jgi:hypothetical protein
MNREFARCVAAVCAVALALSGCATASKDIAPTYISPVQYQSYDCDQIAAEVQRISVRVKQLGGRLDQASTNDALITTVGIVLFWPILFALGGTKQQEAEYSRLKGEYDALEQQAVMKKCPGAVTTTTASTPAPTPPIGSAPAEPAIVPVSATTSTAFPPPAPAATIQPAVLAAPASVGASAPVPPAAPAPPSAPPSPPAVVPVSAPTPVAAAPSVPAISGTSKFMFNAERFAKGLGCDVPVATMNARTAASESFAIACSNRSALVVECGVEGCRETR